MKDEFLPAENSLWPHGICWQTQFMVDAGLVFRRTANLDNLQLIRTLQDAMTNVWWLQETVAGLAGDTPARDDRY